MGNCQLHGGRNLGVVLQLQFDVYNNVGRKDHITYVDRGTSNADLSGGLLADIIIVNINDYERV